MSREGQRSGHCQLPPLVVWPLPELADTPDEGASWPPLPWELELELPDPELPDPVLPDPEPVEPPDAELEPPDELDVPWEDVLPAAWCACAAAV